MNKHLYTIIFFFFCAFCSIAQPANDNCIGAIPLTSSTSGFNFINGNTSGATQSLPACSGTSNDDVWYSFTATDYVHTITIRPSATFDPTFQLFDGCGGSSLGCVNVNGPGAYETKSFSGLMPGQTYVVRVYDWNLPAYEGTTSFDIALQTGYTTLEVPPVAWVWTGGPKTTNGTGTYGSKGVASTSNIPPARGQGASWMNNGELWMFGGFGAGFYNDLWKYDTTAQTWTWISGDNTTAVRSVYGTQGTAAPGNKPGGRTTMAYWKSGNTYWIYGGNGYASAASSGSGYLGDLWKYDDATGLWTWISGSTGIGSNPVFGTTGTPSVSNIPGGKSGGSSWTDAEGNFWFFGGIGYYSSSVSSEGYSNDLWKFNPATSEWTHVKGSKTQSHAGSYGTKGVSSASNLPRARANAHTWVDNNGDFWLFGGEISSSATANDVWKYNIAANEWTWMGGNNSTSTVLVYYGIKGIYSAATNPGGRRYGMTFKDKNGLLWYVGGHKINGTSGTTRYIDAFILDPATGMFKWMGGAGDCCTAANYGTLNVPAASNTPGARYGGFTWSDANGNFWMFGGSTLNNYSDLWTLKGIYEPAAPVNTSGTTAVCAGASLSLSVTGKGSIGWYDAPAGGNYLAGGSVFSTPVLNADATFYAQDSTWTASKTRTAITVSVSVCTGVTASAGTLSQQIYPNPATDYVIFNSNEQSVLTISKTTGEVLLTAPVSKGENKIPLNGFLQGLYIITVQDSEGIKTGKLIVK